jgi:hypothetical protein
MDIHKPKPWHGVREFLKEYLIIVIGVLTALGAEAVVQAVHEDRIANEARESVRAEVRENLWWLERRGSRQPCVRQRIAEISEVLDHARHEQAYPVPLQVGRAFHSKLTSLRWQANAQAGRASLFTSKEQGDLGNMYYTTDQFSRAQDAEEDIWAKLSALQGLDHLTPAEIDTFSMLLAQARHENAQVDRTLARARQWAGVMHLTPEKNPSAGDAPIGSDACPSISAAPVGPVDSLL